MLRHSSIILCACAWVTAAHAQAPCSDSTEVGTLGMTVDALAFFKDNEFDGDVVKGYSLPGFRFTPRLTYTPLDEVHLEAGFHAMVYEGANKYPAYVFHDIAKWKGNQYQHGAHVLPFFRAVAQLGGPTASRPQGRPSRTTIVLGNIYGGQTHRLALPLYNPELTLSDDPEMGCQILVNRPHWHSDLWLNWQSYIFEEDTHQEAFTVGWSQKVNLTSTTSSTGRGWGIPLQLLVQHRGGEQDIQALHLGVQTVANGAAGISYSWCPASLASSTPATARPTTGRRTLTAVHAEALAIACLQQSGDLWPFDKGAAFWAGAEVELFRQLQLKAGIFHAPTQFCSLYGSPFFGTMSLKNEGTTFDGMTTGYWAVQYGKTFTVNARSHNPSGQHTRSHHGTYTLGAKADGYINHSRAPFSFGVYFQASPSFLLKRWR